MSTTEYRTQARDTSVAAELVQFGLFRAMGPVGRARLFDSICTSLRDMADAGTRFRHPHAGKRELLLRFAARHLDRQTVIAAYGWDPESGEQP